MRMKCSIRVPTMRRERLRCCVAIATNGESGEAPRYGGQVAAADANCERSGASREGRAERSELAGVQGAPAIQKKRARQDSNLRPPA
jgi:hypothetical protein